MQSYYCGTAIGRTVGKVSFTVFIVRKVMQLSGKHINNRFFHTGDVGVLHVKWLHGGHDSTTMAADDTNNLYHVLEVAATTVP